MVTGDDRPRLDLSGPWRAHQVDDDLRRVAPEPDLDDDSWPRLTVPGHWRNHPDFAAYDGPVMYRLQFEAEAPTGAQRAWLDLEGIFYQGDVWLDGSYVGDTEGYFFGHSFEVTEALAARREHTLAVEVTCSPQRDRSAKRNITGVFQHWDCIDPDWNPGGIWRPVSIRRTGPVTIRRSRFLVLRADAERAVIAVNAELDSVEAADVEVTVDVDGSSVVETVTLAAGVNTREWTVAVEQPRLWWPAALSELGEPTLVDASLTVAHAGTVSDQRTVRTGLRQITARDWVFSVNGERVFLKGSNQGPTRQDLADASAEDLRRDVDLALDAGLDLLRIHAHVTRPELYDHADERGLLLWQDFPLQWGYARGLRKQAVRQVGHAVDLLGHHPAVALWCGHNEPLGIAETEVPVERRKLVRLAAKMVRHQELPSWNRSVLDASIKRAFERSDPSRPVIAHSGVWPHPPQFDGSDTHVYFGWYHGQARDFPTFCRTIPRMARFVTEFGAQAVPDDAPFIDDEAWPDLDWDHLRHRHALQKNLFDRHVPPGEFETLDAWRAATQRYQAEVIKLHVETLRRLKYRPTGGFAQFCFADSFPSVTWSVLDHARRTKAGFYALAEACRPVIIVADLLPEAPTPGAPLALDVHVVSDLRHPLTEVRCEATLTWTGGEHRWGWTGDIAADSCVRVGTVQAVVPDAPGPLTLDLALTSDEVASVNRYRTTVVAG